jgi:hypothetical protein
VQLQQFLNIKLRRLEDLDLADIHLLLAQSNRGEREHTF